jgi:hypothetical protein
MANFLEVPMRPRQFLEAGIESVIFKGLRQNARLSDLSGGGSGAQPS